MINLLVWTGRVAGLVGVGTAAAAVVLRAAGQWHLGSLQLGTLFQAGVAAMVLGGLAYAAATAERKQA